MKRLVELYDTTWKDGEEYKHSHSVAIYDQPYRHWIWATLFHKFDMVAFRIPGFRLIDKLTPKPNDDFFIPLSNRMDIYCYFLGEKGKIVRYRAEIDEAHYASLSRHKCRWT